MAAPRNITHEKCLAAFKEKGSMKKAAVYLGISPSTVSYYLKGDPGRDKPRWVHGVKCLATEGDPLLEALRRVHGEGRIV